MVEIANDMFAMENQTQIIGIGRVVVGRTKPGHVKARNRNNSPILTIVMSGIILVKESRQILHYLVFIDPLDSQDTQCALSPQHRHPCSRQTSCLCHGLHILWSFLMPKKSRENKFVRIPQILLVHYLTIWWLPLWLEVFRNAAVAFTR